MSKKAVESLIEALYRLVEVRRIFRTSSPTHNLSDDQKEELDSALQDVRQNLNVMEEEMLG